MVTIWTTIDIASLTDWPSTSTCYQWETQEAVEVHIIVYIEKLGIPIPSTSTRYYSTVYVADSCSLYPLVALLESDMVILSSVSEGCAAKQGQCI